MNAFFLKNTLSQKKFFVKCALLCLVLLSLLPLFACRNTIDYFDYVSELRSNIFLAEKGEFSLKIYAANKENPYAMDGLAQETAPRFEAYLLAPEGNQTVTLHFSLDGQTLGGEMSYDNVKSEYYYTCTLDVSQQKELLCTLSYGEEKIDLTAKSVRTEKTLTPRAALNALKAENPAPFTDLTDEYGFSGEIYLRLLYEDAPYYYIGIINREGKTHAFLMNAETGKILASRVG